jgi:hypothetical protein
MQVKSIKGRRRRRRRRRRRETRCKPRSRMGHLLKHHIMRIQPMRAVLEREEIVLTKYMRLDPALKTTAGKAKLVLLIANNDLEHKTGLFLSQTTAQS